MSVNEKMTAIADAIRDKTGGTDPLTLDAMAEAIAGIEAGEGSSGGASGIYMAKITPAEYKGELTIQHNLNTTDILYVAAWVETLGDYVPDTNGITLCKMWAKTDITTLRGGNGFSTGYGWNLTNAHATVNAPNAASYENLTIIDENTVRLNRLASGPANGYIAGLTFTVFVIAANAEV